MPLSRRSLLRHTAAMSAATILRRSLAFAQGPPAAAGASLTLSPGQVLATVPPDFTGLGYEISSVARPGLLSASNATYVQLVKTLGPEGVIRVGGNTADFASFVRAGKVVSAPKGTVVNEAALRELAGFLRATNWKLLWSVNLGSGTATQAVAEATELDRIMGDRLLAIEIGNEPDLFGIEHRPKPYDFTKFAHEFVAFRDQLLLKLPHLPLAGPDAAGSTSWVRKLAIEDPRNLSLLTHHYYREGQNPGSTIAKLLAGDPRLKTMLTELQSVSKQSKLPYRICEVNSFSGGGRPGVSDTFAAALWVLDFMLLVAANGGAGVNLETGVNQLGFVSSYSPIGDDEHGHYTAEPEFYGMLAFREATRSTGKAPVQMIGSNFDLGSPPSMSAYALRDGANGDTVAVLINKDTTAAVKVSLDTGVVTASAQSHPASVLRLRAPEVSAKTGVTFAGSAVAPSGVWQSASKETVAISHAVASIAVPAASAALIRIPHQPTSSKS